MIAGRSTSGTDRGAASVVAVDIDGDGNLDLLDASRAGLRVYQSDGRSFTDVSGKLLGAVQSAPAVAAVAGDYDNDGRADLIVLRPGGLSLLHRDEGAFSDVTAASELTPVESPRSAAWLDADHDGDLDLFVAGGTDASPVTRLFRNNGNGRFSDVTKDAGLIGRAPVHAVVPTDFDNRRDIDVLLASPGVAPLLFRNLRDGAFKDVAADVGLRADRGAAMVADWRRQQGRLSGFLLRAAGRPRRAGAERWPWPLCRRECTAGRRKRASGDSSSTTTTTACSISSCSPLPDRACFGTSAATGPTSPPRRFRRR